MKSVRSLGVAVAVALAATLSQVQSAAAQRYNWSGLYFGAHLGGAWSSSDAIDVLPPAGGFFTPGQDFGFAFDSSGVAGGGQLGYQQQFGNWVLGAEVAGTWADLKDNQISPYFPTSDRVEMGISPIFTATARLGYAWDRWLAYVKGGYAGADVTLNATDSVADVSLTTNSRWMHGYTVGAGMEYALFEGVRIGIDYSYVDLQTGTLYAANTLGASEHFDLSADVHTVSARLNFQLSRPEPAPVQYEPLK